MTVQNRVLAFLVPLAMVLLAGGALAGEAGTVSCTTPGCDYHTDLKIGGAMSSPSVTGYCAKQKKFVRLRLKSWDDYKKPRRCPGSRERLQPIYEGADVARIPCPRCGNRSLEYHRGLLFD